MYQVRQRVFLYVLFCLALIAGTVQTNAAPNPEINYQGKLTNTANVAVPNGTYNMRFWLLTSPSIATTSAVWTESLTGTNKVQVTNGLFSVMLGSTSPLTGVDFNQTLYLGVEVGGTTTPAWDGEMSPRKILGTVPAAFFASTSQNAVTVGGVASTSFLRSDQADTASSLLTFTGGIVANSSSTITNLTADIATTTILRVTSASNLGTVQSGTWNGTAIGDAYLTKSGDWTGTLDSYEGSAFAALSEAETIAGNWVNTANPWADNEVTDTLTISGGTLSSNTITNGSVWTNTNLSITGTTTLSYASTTSLTTTDLRVSTIYAGNVMGANGDILRSDGTYTVWTSRSDFLSSMNSSELATALNDETGSNSVVFSHTPRFTGTIQGAGLALTSSSTLGYASTTALTVSGTASTSNLVVSNGATTTILRVTSASNLGTVQSGTWNGTAIGDAYLTKSGDWTGTLDSYEGSAFAVLSEAETIAGNWVNTANPWADNEVTDTLTISGGTLSSNTITNGSVWTNTNLSITGTTTLSYASTTGLTATNASTTNLSVNSVLMVGGGLGSAPSITFIDAPGTGLYLNGSSLGVSVLGNTYWNFNNAGVFQAGTSGGARLVQTATAGAPTYGFFGETSNDTGMFRASENNLAFSTAGVERFRVDGSGNVGIGTTSPSRLLTVQGGDLYLGGNLTATGTLTVSGNTSLSTITSGTWNGTAIGLAYGGTGANTSAYSSGLLGLTTGTMTDVDTEAEFETIMGADYITVTASDITSANLATALTDETGTGSVVFSASPTFTGTAGFANIYMGTTGSSTLGYASTTALTVAGTLSGLGETTLASTSISSLTVTGTSTIRNIIPEANLAYSIGSSVNRFNEGWINTLNVGTSTWSITQSTSSRFSVFDASSGTGNERLTILTNGNVGIGTTSPSAKFSITGTAGSTTPLLTIASSTGSTLLTVLSGGNVGIGTTSPLAKLDVYGNFNVATGSTPALFVNTASGKVGIGTNDPGVNTLSVNGQLAVATDAYVSGNIAIGGKIYGQAGTNYPIIFANRNDGVEWARMSNGDFGIGTTTPNAKLTIVGTSSASGPILTVASSSGQSLFTVLANGNVGFGTSTPAHPFVIAVTSTSSNPNDATGGTITHSGGYTIHTFTTSGTFTMSDASTSVEYLIVGGGGSGGSEDGPAVGGGGGGGGGVRTGTTSVTVQAYTVTVGAGGLATTSAAYGTNGATSTFASIDAVGGGAGAGAYGGSGYNGRSGASGGGGAYSGASGGSGIAGQGYSGGAGSGAAYLRAGGGGGAGGAGGGGNPGDSTGGIGISSSISGVATYYGGGGGGADDSGRSASGGNGGGGRGATACSGDSQIQGSPNTGGGGGGNGTDGVCLGGDGGSGVVIIRYHTSSSTNSAWSSLFTVSTSSKIGIGITNPTAQLHTTGSVRFATFGAGTLQTDANGNLSVSSDERLKNIGGAFERGVDALRGIKPITYNWNASSGFDTETLYTGFSAQNIQEFIPEAVGMDKHGFLTLSDRPLLATVINATKEQQIILDQLISASSTVLSIKEGDTFWSRLTTLVSNFVDGVLTITGIKTNTVETNEIKTNEMETKVFCVGETCVDEVTLKAILQNNNQVPVLNTKGEDIAGSQSDIASTTVIDAGNLTPESFGGEVGVTNTLVEEGVDVYPESTAVEKSVLDETVPVPLETIVETIPLESV